MDSLTMADSLMRLTSTTYNPCPITEDGLFIEYIGSILTPVICTIGITFNFLNCIVLLHRPVKGPLFRYLLTLSAIDCLYLTIVLPIITFRCGAECLDPPFSALIYEKFVYLTVANILGTADTFVTCAWSIQRLLFIHKPKAVVDRSPFATVAISVSLLAAVVLQAPRFAQWRIEGNKILSNDFNDLPYGIVLMALIKAIPILVLTICNIMLIRTVHTTVERRRSIIGLGKHSAQDKQLRQQNKATILLIAVICLWSLGNIPSTFAYASFNEKLFNLPSRLAGVVVPCFYLMLRYSY